MRFSVVDLMPALSSLAFRLLLEGRGYLRILPPCPRWRHLQLGDINSGIPGESYHLRSKEGNSPGGEYVLLP